MIRLLCLFGLAALLVSGAVARAADPLRVFAAASLRGALEEAFADQDQRPQISYAGSGDIARQIAQGAPADLVILAHREWMDWLDARGHLKAQFPPVHLLGNRLVLIAPAGTAPMDRVDRAALLQRLGRGRLAMGHRTAVPAGVYARAWLEGLGAWTDVQPLLAETANVRAALALVALGESPLGIVYTSDALAEPAVQVLHRVPQNAHPEILYPAAALSPAGQNALGLLQSAPRRAVFVKHGFTRPKGGT